MEAYKQLKNYAKTLTKEKERNQQWQIFDGNLLFPRHIGVDVVPTGILDALTKTQTEIQECFNGHFVYPANQLHTTIGHFFESDLHRANKSIEEAQKIIMQVLESYKDNASYNFEGFLLVPGAGGIIGILQAINQWKQKCIETLNNELGVKYINKYANTDPYSKALRENFGWMYSVKFLRNPNSKEIKYLNKLASANLGEFDVDYARIVDSTTSMPIGYTVLDMIPLKSI